MRDYGLPVSAAAHVAVLAAALIVLPSARPLDPAVESLPVEVMTTEQFDALTKGEKSAKPQPAPQARADKVAEPTPVQESPAETIKREAVATPPPRPQLAAIEPPQPEVKPDPVPEPPKVEPPKPEPEPEAKLEPTPPEPPKVEPKPEAKPEPKPIEKADTRALDDLALKAALDEPKPEPQKPEPPKPPTPKVEPPKPPAKAAETPKPDPKPPTKVADATPQKPSKASAAPPSSFDPSSIAALLSKETPARATRADSQTATTASLGSPRGDAPKLSLSQRTAIVGAIKSHVQRCWSAPTFAADPRKLAVLVQVDLNADGTLSATPSVVKYPAGGSGAAIAGAAMRAIQRCVTADTPLKLPPDLYAAWREIEINFDPSEMAGG